MKNSIKLIFCFLLSGVIAYSYHPSFFNADGVNVGSGFLSICYFILISILAVLAFVDLRLIISNRVVKIFIGLISIIALICMGLYSLGFYNAIKDITTLGSSFVALCIGYTSQFNRKQLIELSTFYAVAVILIGGLQVQQNIGGVEILETYAANAKNSLGPMLTMAGLLTLLMALMRDTKKIYRLFSIVLSIVSFAIVVIIRARFAMVIYLLIATYVFVRYVKEKRINNMRLMMLMLILLVVLMSTNVVGFIIESFTLNREEDLTSGRAGTYVDGINIFMDHPLLGNLALRREIGWVHNYPLLKLSEYGLLVSLPWLILYVFLFYKILKGVKNSDIFLPEFFGWVIISVSFLTSFGEPIYPYGPGSVNFMAFLLFGVALFNMKNNTIKV